MGQFAFDFKNTFLHCVLGSNPLMVRDAAGDYVAASPDQILAAAREAIDAKMARGQAFSDPGVASEFFASKIGGFEREIFGVAYLDTRHCLIRYAELFAGSIDSSEVHPREVVKAALACNAAAVLLTHNHPSGNTTPSAADRAVTVSLKQALALVDVRVLDHIVVAGSATTSMASLGWV